MVIDLNKLKKENERLKGKTKSKKSSVFKKVSSSFGYNRSLSSNLNKQFSGSKSQSQGTRPVGRPAGPASFKHRSPFTGQPIPATEFYKQIREFRRRQTQQAQVAQNQQVQQLVKRGLPPQVAQQVVQQRVQQVPQQLTPEQIQQIQMQRQMQNQNQSNAVRPIWRRSNVVRYERDIFGNIKEVQGGNDPKNFWN